MEQRFEKPPNEPGADRPHSGGRLAPALLIAAIVLLIAIATILLG